MEIRDKWAIVTGSARRLGKGIALGLARAGANLVVHYGHSSREAQETARDIEALGVRALPMQADLGDPLSIEALFQSIRLDCGGLDVLVNSAASFTRQPFEEAKLQDWDDVLDLNARAPWLCMKHAARLMRHRIDRGAEEGVIVNIADLTGLQPWPGYSHHGVSKAALIHLTRIAARELAPEIRVNCVVPGAILPPPEMSETDRRWREKAQRIPLQRAGDPRDVADAVLFLVRNSFVTGSVLAVDGGEHLLGGQAVV